MNADYEKRLESEVHRTLQDLPGWAAPQTLLPRVMAGVSKRSRLQWRQGSWQTWSWGFRGLIFCFLAVVFAGLCLGAWMLPHCEGLKWLARDAAHAWTGVTVLGNAIGIVLGVVAGWLRQIRMAIVAPCLTVLALGYVMCVGLGTVCIRWAFARS